MAKQKHKLLPFIFIIALIAIAFFLYKTDFYRDYFYPKKYTRYVIEYSSQNNIDENFVYAVIRTESGFDENAVSDVGARGLMQLMDTAFEWVQFRISEDRDVTYDDMFDPQYNIEYGSFMLGFLYERYDSYELAAAAYHSGMTRVDNWLKDGTIDAKAPDIDDIPSDVTRHYIKKVMKAYNAYKNLY